MSILAKIGVFSVAILLVFSLLAPLLTPFFEEQVIPRFGGSAPGEPAPINGEAKWQPDPIKPGTEPRYDIITVLGYDAIPAILEPKIVSIEEADEWMAPSEQVIGLSINGDHRAYSIPMLSRHEIVNDTVGGKPVAVTW
jgi:hypothetical protein